MHSTSNTAPNPQTKLTTSPGPASSTIPNANHDETPSSLKKVSRRLVRLAKGLEEAQWLARLNETEARTLVEQLESVERLVKRAKGRQREKDQSDPALQRRQQRAKAKREFEVGNEHGFVLRWLRDQKFATTSQVKTYVVLERATDRLRELEGAGLLDSYRYEPNKGYQSEKCYWLSYRGAKYLTDKENLPTRYESRYATHPPSDTAIHFRTMELQLPFLARQAGWKVIEPKFYNSSRPRPQGEPTEQGRLLLEVLSRWVQREKDLEPSQIAGRYNSQPQTSPSASTSASVTKSRAGSLGMAVHLNKIPTGVNHHLCYLPQADEVIIFILCPENITSQFWERRIKEYGQLAHHVPIYGVFYTPQQAQAWSDPINESGIKVVSLVSLPTLLRDYTAYYTAYRV